MIQETDFPTVDLSTELLKLSPEQLNIWLLQGPTETERQYPGYLEGKYLFQKYDETVWGLADEELQNNVLYSGCENFDGLRHFTFERINEILLSLPASDSFNYIDRGNIARSLQLAQDFMQEEHRRTGEPGVAHIYRTVLRTLEIIEILNSIAASRDDAPYIDALGAEFLICTAIMHDFLEDSDKRDADSEKKGFVVQTENSGMYFGIRDHGTASRSSGFIDFKDNVANDVFLLTLEALNSSMSPDHLMEHLESEVKRIYLRTGQEEDNNIFAIAAYIVKCCDRLDNNATYFKIQDKLIEKAIENLRLFSNVLSKFQQCARDEEFSLEELVRLKRHYLHYLPDRVSKLLLAGFSPREIYKRHESGRGIPRSM